PTALAPRPRRSPGSAVVTAGPGRAASGECATSPAALATGRPSAAGAASLYAAAGAAGLYAAAGAARPAGVAAGPKDARTARPAGAASGHPAEASG
ncbi:MAG: hypothetical protein ACREOE_19455, partial [Gemmatimonadales bacterium]